ncbi:hypothetical protein [Arundinibacter roseus]|uniref:Uncharacterized protein n=1 Tax=Arundinibacter roseus TaxID=2070510 RepID=A0A4R4K5U3_9BACT|nr:hypothetical protein [Arundinibacter roseus]TDB62760.1 hypothetical protein EZE20_17655 [Arundinibacter roseus]
MKIILNVRLSEQGRLAVASLSLTNFLNFILSLQIYSPINSTTHVQTVGVDFQVGHTGYELLAG